MRCRLICLLQLDEFLEKTFVFPSEASVFAWFVAREALAALDVSLEFNPSLRRLGLRPRDHGCGPDRFISRSARKTLLCRFAIHCRPLEVTLR